MSYVVESRWGGSERAPTVRRMRELLAELDTRDEEHPDTWLQHESGWCLSAHELGFLVWENAETEDPPRHLRSVAREKVLELWIKLSQGRIAEIESEPWQPGYGTS